MAKDQEFDYSQFENQSIVDMDIKKEMETSFMEYSLSVIISRALPDVRDGFKPVHRRIIYAMYDDKLTYDQPTRKSATTVGNVLGHYHPHGDQAVYNAMVRMAQPFSLRYPLIDGQGNFGNIDGDGAAAYRYTEARLSKISNLLVKDIEKNTVNFMPNFDNKATEPEVLPCRFPQLLVNGTIGIAVGMATSIPPHNMNEVIDACIHMIENPDCSIVDLMQFVKAPDFPTHGIIHGTAGLYAAYHTGKGKVKVRAKTHFEEKGNRTSIIVTELPYQVNRTMLLDNIADLVKNKRIEGISGLRNESGRKGMRIVIEVKREANPQIVLNQLFKYTQLQETCSFNMLALVNGKPKVLNLKEILFYYLRHQEDVIRRRTKFELEKAEREAHIYEGYKKIIDNLDEAIKIIRASKNVADSKINLIARFDLSEVQAQAIVEMTLGRLSGMERQKIEERLETLLALIEELKGIIADETKIIEIIKNALIDVKNKFGDERRTAIELVDNEILDEDLIEKSDCVITITRDGYIKRLPAETYSAQRRGGKGITAMATKEEDFVQDVYICYSHDIMLMFSNKGKMYRKKSYEIPEASRTAKGTNLVNVLTLDEGEKITTIIPVKEFSEDTYLAMITKMGVIKRVNLTDYKSKRTGGLFAINLDEGDELLYVLKTSGKDNIFIASRNGYSIMIDENDVRCMGRGARGVRAMMLRGGDYLVGAALIPSDYKEQGLSIITITEKGYGKKSSIDEFKEQHRGGKGMYCHKLSEKTGLLAGTNVVTDDDDLMLITESGMIIRTGAEAIPTYGRTAGGVIIMRLSGEAYVTGFAKVKKEEPEELSEPDQESDIIDEAEGFEQTPEPPEEV
ncbi:DNA gyrase subunit A [Eubacteriales bacterium OttesenSCG-928-G02]|nr:DNA gyrase subunit A [Eubacteriales bacterium OttesenSCG-928-G02]